MSADCANRIDQWQALGFEERMETTEKELALMQKTGYNSVRLILEYVVWRDERDSFLKRFDRYLDTCAKYGISCMITLANDCMPPRNKHYKEPAVGKQEYDWGYHGGKSPLRNQHAGSDTVGVHFFDIPEQAQLYYEMVREIVTLHKDDPRISIWDIYNEPGGSNRSAVTMPHLKKLFEIVREIDPSQPLTCGLWSAKIENGCMTTSEVQQYGLDNSDIISYHNYGSLVINAELIKQLKKLGRPILCTEWLGRIFHNTIQEMLPVFYMEKIGCFNWGFVAGKYQTYEPWEVTWKQYDENENMDVDFTKWFHDLYRPNHRPYDPKEIKMIQYLSEKADAEFKNEQATENNQP